MNIEDTLREQLPDLSAGVPGGPSLQRALQKGRARRRRRALAAVGSGVATVCAVGVVAGAALTGVGPFAGDEPQDDEPQWALAVPPQEMPSAMANAARAQLPDGVEVESVRLRAYDDNERRLPRQRWDESVDWRADLILASGELVTVGAARDASATEGNGDQVCRWNLNDGSDVTCEYFRLRHGVDLFEEEWPARDSRRNREPDVPMWFGSLLTADADDPHNPEVDEIDPSRVWFARQVDVENGDYYVTAVEYVNASTYQRAKDEWTLDMDALRGIALSPELMDPPADD